jgi:hypothetical protein
MRVRMVAFVGLRCIGSGGSLCFLGLRVELHEIGFGENAHDLVALEDDEAADLVLQQDARGFLKGDIGRDGHDLSRHGVRHENSGRDASSCLRAIAERFQYGAAEQIGLTDDPDELPRGVEDRQVADPTQAHDVVRGDERVTAPQGHYGSRHQVAHEFW